MKITISNQGADYFYTLRRDGEWLCQCKNEADAKEIRTALMCLDELRARVVIVDDSNDPTPLES